MNKKELNDCQQINYALYNFYQTLFKEKLSISEEYIQSFLDKVSLPKLNENQILKCEGAITESELLKTLTFMNNDKSPGNDAITKKFSTKFWDVVKEPLCASVQQSFIVGELSTSKKQTIIKLSLPFVPNESFYYPLKPSEQLGTNGLIEKKGLLKTYLTSKCRYETNLEGTC